MQELIHKCFIALSLAGAMLLAAPTPANAQDLWGGARAGMTVEQVRRLFPDARPTTTAASAQAQDESLLTIDHTEVAGEPFRVGFVFHRGKLTKVGLVYLGAKPFEALLPLYNTLLERLRAEHGASSTSRSERGMLTNNEEHTWRDERHTIQMSMTSYLDRDAVLAIRYQAATAD